MIRSIHMYRYEQRNKREREQRNMCIHCKIHLAGDLVSPSCSLSVFLSLLRAHFVLVSSVKVAAKLEIYC